MGSVQAHIRGHDPQRDSVVVRVHAHRHVHTCGQGRLQQVMGPETGMLPAFVGSRVGDALVLAVGEPGLISSQVALGADHFTIITRLAFQLIPGFSQAVEAAPDEAVHSDDHEGDHDGGQEQDGKTARVGGGVDLRAQADGLEGTVLDVGVFSKNRSVPGSAGGCDHAGDEVGEDSGENEFGPALPAGEVEEGGDFAEVGGDGHGSGDDVEEDVPLRAEEHKNDGADAQAAADFDQADEQDGEEGRGRDGSQYLRKRLHEAGEPGAEADGDADGDGPGGGDEQGCVYAEKGGSGALQQQAQFVPGDGAEHEDSLRGAPTCNDDCGHGQSPESGGGFAGLAFIQRMDDAAVFGEGHAAVDGFINPGKDAAGQGSKQAGAAEQFKDGRSNAVGGLDLLDFELVAPGDERAPGQLIGGDDDEDHNRESSHKRAHVGGVSGGLQVAAQAGQLEVASAHGEHLAGHEGKPSAGDGDDGVPDQADGGEGHLKLPEALPGGVAIDARGFQHLPGDGLQRGIETEGEVPDLAGEDEQDNAHFDAHLTARNERDHGQHDGGQKAEHGNGLQDIEDRDHPGLEAGAMRGGVAVGDGEDQAEQVRNADAHDGVKGVGRQRANGVRDGHHGNRFAHPVDAGADDGKEDGQRTGGHSQIDEERPGAGNDRRSRKRVLELHSLSSLGAISSSCASGNTKR